jgi:formylglycine-generating enzyme required for sulfatase activity
MGNVPVRILLLFALCLAPSAVAARIRPVVPEMVRVPAGTFVAGSTPAETQAAGYPAEAAAREQPQRSVVIPRTLAFARTEVTRAAFARFAAATGWRSDGPCGWLADARANRWVIQGSRDWRDPGYPQTGRHPVVCVSFADAQAYARWLSRETGRRFRLPTGDEWEYAARAGTRTRYPWGDDAAPAICRHGNVADRARARANGADGSDVRAYMPCDDGFAATAPAGSLAPNPWGLHDMIGNVWEWTTDCLDASCISRVDRGASWTNSPKYVRIAARHPDLAAGRTSVLGFRVVEDLP